MVERHDFEFLNDFAFFNHYNYTNVLLHSSIITMLHILFFAIHMVCSARSATRASSQARAQSVNTILVGYYDIPSREEQPLKMVINPTGNEERSRQRYAAAGMLSAFVGWILVKQITLNWL